MHTPSQKRAPVVSKLKNFACRVRQLFKIGKAKQVHHQKFCVNNNNNCESENNNNINSELCSLAEQLTNEMAQNAANEWLLQHGDTVLHGADADAYAEDTESHVICLHTEAGQFYWSAVLPQATELHTYCEIDWQ